MHGGRKMDHLKGNIETVKLSLSDQGIESNPSRCKGTRRCGALQGG
jgi:hypothetical protein